jgi:Chitin binding Peritrophin-A domain
MMSDMLINSFKVQKKATFLNTIYDRIIYKFGRPSYGWLSVALSLQWFCVIFHQNDEHLSVCGDTQTSPAYHCSRYYVVCSNGLPFSVHTCPLNTVFDKSHGACRYSAECFETRLLITSTSKHRPSEYPHLMFDVLRNSRQVKFGDVDHRHTLSAKFDSSRDPRQIKFGKELTDGGTDDHEGHVMAPRQVKFYVIPDRTSAASFGPGRRPARQVKFRSVGDDPVRKWPLGYIVKKWRSLWRKWWVTWTPSDFPDVLNPQQ